LLADDNDIEPGVSGRPYRSPDRQVPGAHPAIISPVRNSWAGDFARLAAGSASGPGRDARPCRLQNLLVDHSDRAVTSGAFPRKRLPLAMCGAWRDAAGWCAPG
jgi:hypothetical protein